MNRWTEEKTATEGRSPVDILLARAAELEREAKREVHGPRRDGSFGYVYLHSDKEREKMRKEAAALVERAMKLEAEHAANPEGYHPWTRPFVARAGGPSSRRQMKRGW